MLPKALLKTTEAQVGETVEVRFRLAGQEAVEIPDILAAALAQDGQAESAWASLSPGKQRGLAHRIASAKRAETRAARLTELLQALRAGEAERLFRNRR